MALLKHLLAVTGLALIAAAPGCGEDSAFSAEEFVQAANREGAGLVLGEPLESLGSATKVHAVELDGAGEQDGHGHGSGGGSLVVATSEQGAMSEFDRCEQAVSLVCFRAANVVLRVDSVNARRLARIEAAVRAVGASGEE